MEPPVPVYDLRALTGTFGGKVRKNVTEVSEMGWFSVIRDRVGSILGLLWKSELKIMYAYQGTKEKASSRKQGANKSRARVLKPIA
jgi:hypothetical protein